MLIKKFIQVFKWNAGLESRHQGRYHGSFSWRSFRMLRVLAMDRQYLSNLLTSRFKNLKYNLILINQLISFIKDKQFCASIEACSMNLTLKISITCLCRFFPIRGSEEKLELKDVIRLLHDHVVHAYSSFKNAFLQIDKVSIIFIFNFLKGVVIMLILFVFSKSWKSKEQKTSLKFDSKFL